ncbi:hypothetical protein ZIOFF_063952 [Zingiber officinale]|uniref:Uncharacterized protein n=1 Tax=Zingiber officinale TaxID=94328 RepID=A0A8J5F6X1_ZINOF|nr:hypothetical protein ZIOFF_063952 [Zingiber officinale]
MKMAGSTRMESTSSSMDGSHGTNFPPAYQNGQRGTHLPPGLERSGSFRENMENRSLFAGPGTLRNAASSSEVPTVSQYLPLDTFSWGEQRFSRTGEIRRVLGVTVEDHTFGSAQSKPVPPIAPEDLRRLKGSVYESSNRARERSKSFQDLAMKLDRYRNLVSRKRQRMDQSNEKSGTSNPMKMGNQTHQSPTELASPRLEDRKNAIPNKRIRSSMAEVRLENGIFPFVHQSEVRGAIPPRQGVVEKDRNVLFEKDKTMLRGCNGGSVPSEDKMCGLPPMGDGWDKKMKRKRSVGLNRVMESDREIKSIQQRPSNESRMRSSDAISFRPGLSSGTTVSNKMDGCSQPSVSNSRGTPKIELESGSVPNERREFSSGVDNERIMHKGGNKLNVHDDGQAGNQSSLVKGKASRGPRTVLGASMNSSPSFLRSSGNIDGWEQGTGASKVQSSTVANRKRPIPNESSSPPVTQWVGQRPQKISRTRRVNVVSPVSNLDEAQFLAEGYPTPEVGARMTTMDNSGLLVPRVIPNKLKHDNVLSPAVLSESEESAAVESKFKDKGNDSFELEDGAQTSLKVSSFLLPTKKNKTPPKEEIGDGVRRQGRSGRSSVQSKACLPVAKEKMESIDANKPLKNKKMGPERSESRIGRPPSKKMSDRKAYARPQIMTSVSSESAGTSTDDRDDLLASANDARSASCNACSNSSFWKKMEPIFASLTLEEISFVKHQIHFAEEVDASLSDWPETDHEGGRGSSSHKAGITKVAKQLAMAFAKRTLERCHIFEKTGRSCFSESTLRDILLSGPPNNIDTSHTDGFGSNSYVDLRSGEFGVRQTGLTTVKHGLGKKMDRGLSDPYQSVPQMGEHAVTKRKKEVLLDDVTGAASRSLSTHAHSLATSTKWKKSERDQEQNKDASGRSSTAKAGRPSLGSGRGERKLKTKPKQKIAQLSTSGNGLGRVTETDSVTSPALREAFETVNSSIAKFDQEVELQSSSNRAQNSSKEFDDGIFTNLPLNGIDPIDELDVAEGLGGQGQDIASWLNVDEEALQDQDLVGLEIPMDDLSELKLNF